jgi:hypothetical protein
MAEWEKIDQKRKDAMNKRKIRELKDTPPPSPKSNPRSQALADSLLNSWLDRVFGTLPDIITLPATIELLHTLGLLSDRQTFESVPLLDAKQKRWVSQPRADPPKYVIARIKRSIQTAISQSRPRKFDAFARPLVLLAFAERNPIPEANSLDPNHREIIVYTHRFELFEPHMRRRLIDWRSEFHGKITFRPDTGHYLTIHKDMPARLIRLCKSLRIKHEVPKNETVLIVADLAELLPKKKRKGKKKAKPPEPPKPSRRSSSAPPPEGVVVRPPAEAVAPFLRENISVFFRDFPSQPVLADGPPTKEAELVLVLDVQKYSLPAVRDYVWEALRWAAGYPFITMQFVTGPVVRSPILSDPQRRTEVQKTIEMLQKNERIVYTWSIPKENQSMIICRFKSRLEEGEVI